MDLKQAILERHSVRHFTDRKIEKDAIAVLHTEIDTCNAESGLHIQLITDEPKAFGSFLVHYGLFKGVRNYFALIGKNTDNLDEKVGYYGERLVLLAQTLGLNTCWVAATFGKGAVKKVCTVENDEKLVCVIALGYGVTQGILHKSKSIEALYKAELPLPGWFKAGMEAAVLAPTARNQQKFHFTLSGGTVTAESTGGLYAKVDLGIVKYHFEVGADKENFRWAVAQ